MNAPTPRLIILPLLLMLFFLNMHAGSQEVLPGFTRLIEQGEEAFKKHDYTNALQYFTQADILISKYDMPQHQVLAKFNLGKSYSSISSYADALKYYHDALVIAKKNPGNEEKMLTTYVNIGVIYDSLNEHENALEYYKKANVKAKEIGSAYNMGLSAINIASVYNILGDYKMSRKYLDEVKHLPMSKEFRLVMEVNYAESYFREGDVNRANSLMHKVLAKVDTKNETECYYCVLKLLSEIYVAKGDLGASISYARKALQNTRRIADKIEMYEHIADIYLKNKDFDEAFRYKDSVILAKDAFSKAVKREVFEANKVRLKIQDYQSEAAHNKDRRELERNIFILVIVFGITLFYFIYRSLKNRIIKQKQQSIIASDRRKIDELELKKLSNDIAEKNRKLSAKALYLSGRNELIEEIINSLEQIPEIQANIQPHIHTLKEHIKADDEWDDFITYFEQVNPEFIKTLQIRHPQLTPADIRFICYLYMNLDLKEISSIFSITLEASKKRKQRIAKKMELEMDHLQEYLLRLN